MSAQGDFRLNLVAALAAETDLASTQVLPGPPAENQDPKESVWVASVTSRYDWRSLGAGTQLLRNRTEQLTATVKVNAYNEDPNQTQGLAVLDARVDDIVAAIENAVAADPTIGGAVSYALLESVSRNPIAAQSGWVIDVTCQITGTNHP
jgi:hypothetical protein